MTTAAPHVDRVSANDQPFANACLRTLERRLTASICVVVTPGVPGITSVAIFSARAF